jgi:NAD(P)-dependent dehydrogenase (short-subunit alcohol dehydrogenase family)
MNTARIALVTGANRGIGLAVARGLASEASRLTRPPPELMVGVSPVTAM